MENKKPKNPNLLEIFKNKKNIYRFLGVILILLLGEAAYLLGGFYVDTIPAQPANDLIHNLLEPMNLNLIVTYLNMGIMFLAAYIFLIKYPSKFPNFFLAYGIFLIVRTIFFSVTTIGAPLNRIDDHSSLGFGGWFFTQDLFPSGHTALPFLSALATSGKLRWTFGILALIMGISVVLMQVHYTMDVLGTFFVGFTVYYISEKYLVPYLKFK